MRILHRINLNVSGGVENQFCAFLAHPRVRERLRNRVLIGEPIHPGLAPGVSAHTEAVYSFKRWHGLPLPRRPRTLRAARTIAVIGACRPDALLSWSAFAKPELAVACRRTGIPLLYREGGGAWGEADPDKAARFLAGVRRVFCNTYASMRMLQLKWGYAGDAVVCLGGVRPDLLALSRQARDERPKGESRPARRCIGMAARLVHEKGICLGLHALRELRDGGLDVELMIAGYGEEEAKLKTLCDDLDIVKHVCFLGNVSDMQSFYRDIDILLHPALQEPLGNSTIEASIFGCPVVASRVDGLAETVEHGVTGYSLPATGHLDDYRALGGGVSRRMSRLVYDPDMDALREPRFTPPAVLAEAVAKVLTDDALRAGMGEAAREHAMTRFSYDRHIRLMVDGITESLG